LRDRELAPDPQLMESMRAVGYTLETAVADLIDNSLTACADEVDLLFTSTPAARIAILDNGVGMDEGALTCAMKLAGRPPTVTRDPHDLGRFGLGLKTASLSQARSVTVVSSQGGLRAVRWDLDHLAATRTWSLQVLDENEILRLPWVERLIAHETGTLILWQHLDHIHAPLEHLEGQLDERMRDVRNHLALVFHRFITTASPPLHAPLKLRINGSAVPTLDPFLTNNRATQTGPQEVLQVEGQQVTVQPYTLPHASMLRATDREAACVAGTLRDSQGFYVYRSGRLLLWGTWFRIIPRDELGKLARVKVDIPNSLDHLWALDIKKSSAAPPPEVRRRLAQFADRIVGPSRRTHTYRGRTVSKDKVDRLWTLIDERDNFRYELNRSHPLIGVLSENLEGANISALSQLLRAIESSFPVEDAYNRLGSDASHTPATMQQPELAETARRLQQMTGETVTQLSRRLALVEPFSAISDLESFLREAMDE
jgi:hypothetical protein